MKNRVQNRELPGLIFLHHNLLVAMALTNFDRANMKKFFFVNRMNQ
jgi:hypothetical protein